MRSCYRAVLNKNLSCDLPLNAQAKLLRALQERTVCRLGSAKEIKIDVRVIAATNRNLQQLAADGLFREDLYYCLNVIIDIVTRKTRTTQMAEARKAFIVVSDIYPTKSTEVADVILPSASWVEKEGVFGNTERRTQQWFKMIEPPGEAKEDTWQLIEFAKRIGHGGLFPYSQKGFYKEMWEEYRKFTIGTGKDLAPYETYFKVRGLRWPVKANGQGTRWRYTEVDDPYVKKGEGVKFYKGVGNKANVWYRPYEPPAESPDKQYPFWYCTGRLLEHWHTATMTGRVPELRRAMPGATLEIHPDDAARLGIKNRDKVKVSSRRGSVILTAEINGRGKPEKGNVFTTFFDETKLINDVCIDAYDPISKEPEYKKCAVKIEKA